LGERGVSIHLTQRHFIQLLLFSYFVNSVMDFFRLVNMVKRAGLAVTVTSGQISQQF